MKTHEMLRASEAELVPVLRDMKIKELERHATKLLNKLGGQYVEVLAVVTQTIPTLNSQENPYQALQQVIRQTVKKPGKDSQSAQFSHAEEGSVENEDDAVFNLVTILMMVIVKKQFLKIHNGQPLNATVH